MEKTIVIDGKPIRFKTSGAVVKRYMMQFQRDFFDDIFKMAEGSLIEGDLKELDRAEMVKVVRSIDFNVFYDIAWTFAKTADSTIPDPLTWLDGFDEFPIFEILPELQELLTSAIATKKK